MRDLGGNISFRLYFKFLYFYIAISFEGQWMKGLSYEYPMYFGATPPIFKMANELRKEETEAEKILWKKLNKNQIMGLHFRRQHPINMLIADFYCAKIKLVIEIDGSIHEISEYQQHDTGRSEILNDF